jgi:RNA polymerase sigma-70 factor (ECF subfamily)
VTVQRSEERLRALMVDSLRGDAVAYRELLTDVGDRLRVFYRRRLGRDDAIADDLVQETLIAIHVKRFTYDVERPFTAWLYAIARYKLIDHLRTARIERHIPLEDADDELFHDETEARDAALDVDRLLDEVPARTRSLVRAVKIEGRSVADVSASSGLSESAVKVAIHRALKGLAKRLQGPNLP